jgi:hypothetical protein
VKSSKTAMIKNKVFIDFPPFRRHEWFRLDLPPYLKSSNCFRIFMKEFIHEGVVANALKVLSLHPLLALFLPQKHLTLSFLF